MMPRSLPAMRRRPDASGGAGHVRIALAPGPAPPVKVTRTLKQALLKVPAVRELRERAARALLMANSSSAAKTGQLQLALSWKALARRGDPLPAFADVEFRAYSQNGEDGILLYLFSLLGTTNKLAVEICAGDGIQCNATNLILNHGWTGLLVDGGEEEVAAAAPSSRRIPTRSRSRRPSCANGSTARPSTTSSRSTASAARSICCRSTSTASTTGSGRRST